jgi:RsiW-degrading membrane proteinase PrsW (M82 family)
MPVRLKKLIGVVLIVALVVLYALVATTVATYRLADSPWWVHLLYFMFSGVLWVVPAMFIIRWMERPPRTAPRTPH